MDQDTSPAGVHWQIPSVEQITQGKGVQVFDYLIKYDEFFYCSAHYYKAFALIKLDNLADNKEKFLEELRKTGVILQQQIQMHESCSMIMANAHQQAATVYYKIDAYKKQKENCIQILELFAGSVRNLIGDICTAEGLERTGMDSADAHFYFNKIS